MFGCPKYQCLATTIFIYFAVLAPVITFGGLLGDATGGRVAVVEALLGQCLVGTAYALLSGQPLSVIGATGPILIFEGILFRISTGLGLQYLPFRCCVGLWMAAVLAAAAVFNLSAAVRYITRFTEENFALFIAVIFIGGSFKKMAGVAERYPMASAAEECHVVVPGNNGTRAPAEDPCPEAAPDVFMTSVVLFCGTFLLATSLKKFRGARYFPARVRALVSDFAVVLALLSMTIANHLLGVATPRLDVPDRVAPSSPEGRVGWLVSPLGTGPGANPWWSAAAAALPAALSCIIKLLDKYI